MATYKVDIPIPAPKDSDGFTSALKVVIAATVYDVPVQYAQAPGQDSAALEAPRDHKSLIESNSIVRFCSKVGTKPWTAPSNDVLKDSALVEFEESVLSSLVKSNADEALKLAQGLIAKADLPTSETPSPASIVLFSRLYDVATKSSLSEYPELKNWFTAVLGSSWAKSGIEKVAALTTVNKEKSSKGPKQATEVLETTERVYVSKLRDGIGMKVPKVGEKILPVPGEKNILITSALPYVNNVPHLGNIIGSVLSADAYSRYCKARNYNTLYICGTDEYGTATETKALEEGVSPNDLCTKYNALHADIYKWFEIEFDHFGRTPTDAHTEICQEIFLKLKDQNFLVEETMTQLYCDKHDGFLADRFVEGTCPKCAYDDARGDQCDKCGQLLDPLELINPRCKIDGNSPVQRDSKHTFIELDKLQPEIEEWSKKSAEIGKWSSNGRIITESWLKQGLKKRCITRDLKWGVKVPLEGYEKKVMYVWFDACIGYVSITANYTKEWKKWWRNKEADIKLYQFMGKDNVPFHTVVFPASLLGTRDGDWTMLHHISTTEYLQYEGGKFSKSRGVGVFGNSAEDTGIPPDVWRYYLLSFRPETGDTQFVWKDFITKNNSELLANFGNFVNRLIKFVNAKYSGIIPDYTKGITDPSFFEYKDNINTLLASYIEELENCHLRAGIEKVMSISAEGNRFLQDNKLDNNLFNNFPEKAAAVVGFGLNLIYLLSAICYPYMPATSQSICQQLNAPLRSIPETWAPEDLLPGHVIGKAAYLFSRIDEKKEDEWRNKYGGKQEAVVKDDKKKEKAKGKKGAKQAKKDSEGKKAEVEVREG
ncbi:tRNA synthetases class I (M)-domain-containing protein [Geopyxis carbonaria]|nr:tRNA synthetases class I (M)-domain-containing protein [Geopyxis carbonaria]